MLHSLYCSKLAKIGKLIRKEPPLGTVATYCKLKSNRPIYQLQGTLLESSHYAPLTRGAMKMAIIRQPIKGCGANETNEGKEVEEGCRGQYSCFLIGGEGHTGTSTEVKIP